LLTTRKLRVIKTAKGEVSLTIKSLIDAPPGAFYAATHPVRA
jgi:hypothetical protein